MGNGIPFNLCCTNHNNNIKDIDINKVSSDMNTVKEINSPSKEMNRNFEEITKTDITGNKYKGNNFNTFRKRNLTQGGPKRKNSDFIHNQNISLFNNTFQILKNNQYISFSNMNIFKNNLNNRLFNSYFNSKLGKNSSFYFSGVNDKFDSNFKKIKTRLKLTGELFANKTLEIDKFGLKRSLKKKLDGIISFGIKGQDELGLNNKYDYTPKNEENVVN